MSDSYLFVLMAIAIGGSYVGRWLHRCVVRFPPHYPLRDQLTSVWREADCRSCHTWESGLQHVPLIGWLIAGRCRSCNRKMDARRPVVELLTGLLLAWLYWVEIPDFGSFVIENSGLWTGRRPPGPEAIEQLWSPVAWLHLRYFLHAVLLCGLIVATVIDFELCIIPDGCTIPAMIFAVLFSFAVGQTWLTPVWFQDPSTVRIQKQILPEAFHFVLFEWDAVAFSVSYPHWHGLLVSLAGLFMGAAVTWCIRAIGFLVLKKEAMGDGDVVLMALIGAVVGWQPVLVAFFLAPLAAIPFAIGMWILRRKQPGPLYFPYGPWLSLAAVILLLGWQAIWPRTTPIFDMGMLLFVVGTVMMLTMAALLYFSQLVKRLLGIEEPELDDDSQWSSADHLNYYAGERPDEETGLWSRPQWPGSRSGRGLGPGHDWRNPQ